MGMTGAAAEVISVVVIIIIIINVQLHCCTVYGEHCEHTYIVKCGIHINGADERFGFNMFVSTYSTGWKSFATYIQAYGTS